MASYPELWIRADRRMRGYDMRCRSRGAAGLVPEIVPIIGLPGAGKSTLARFVERSDSSTAVINSGAVLRRVAAQLEIGMAEYASGQLPCASTLGPAILSEIEGRRLDGVRRILIDGFPRSVEQLSYLCARERDLWLDVVVHVDVRDHRKLTDRIARRRVCVGCGATGGDDAGAVCIICGSVLSLRCGVAGLATEVDRIAKHELELGKLLRSVKASGAALVRIDGEGSMATVRYQAFRLLGVRHAD